jgi:hypothetical protein
VAVACPMASSETRCAVAATGFAGMSVAELIKPGMMYRS